MQKLSVVFLAVVVVPVAGCDLFGIRCDADADCPPEQEFCNLGICSTVDGPVRAEGEGEEGEGEGGACDSDADCGSGLCYDAPDSESHYEASRVGTCVPGPDDDVSCAEAAVFGERPSGGQSIYSATAFRSAGSCTPGTASLTFEIASFDRELDGPGGEGTVFVLKPGDTGSPTIEAASLSANSGEHTAVFFAGFGSTCYPDDIEYVAVATGLSAPTSNGLCIPIQAGSP